MPTPTPQGLWRLPWLSWAVQRAWLVREEVPIGVESARARAWQMRMTTQVRLGALGGGEIGGRGGILTVGARAAGGAEGAVGAMCEGSRRVLEGLGEVVAGCLGTTGRRTTMQSARNLSRRTQVSRCMLCLLEMGSSSSRRMTKAARRRQSGRVHHEKR